MRPDRPIALCIAMLAILHYYPAGVEACSNFLMDNKYGIGVRTMDLGVPLSFGVATVPRGSQLSAAVPENTSRWGFVGFIPIEAGLDLYHFVTAGLSERGLSCDMQTLLGTVYPNATGDRSRDVSIDNLCEYILATATSLSDVETWITSGKIVVHGPSIAGGQHIVMRDGNASLVLEFLEGNPSLFWDLNDAGKTGYGILTNEPPFQWQVANVDHAKWKLGNADPSFAMPGDFYPDSRFIRIYSIKSGMSPPASHEEAMQQAIHALNSITVPPGKQMGTDSSKGEGLGDHTKFAVIYDFLNLTTYWRSLENQNLMRLRLVDASLDQGSSRGHLSFKRNVLPWFHDAASNVVR